MELNGKITKGLGGIYQVKLTDGDTVSCSVRGLFRKSKITPTIGDDVTLIPSGDPDVEYVISKIHPRRSFLIRPPVANVDVLLLCFAVKDPEPDLKLLDKMLVVCALMNIKPVIIFTKADIDPESADKLHDVYSKAGFDCFKSSVSEPVDAKSVFELAPQGSCFGFAGPSGVGKSTLCNHLLTDEKMEVGNISERLKRGKHTTRHVELFEFDTCFVMDTPGFTSLSLVELGVEYKSVILGFPEIAQRSRECRFDDCRHASERDCAVLASVGTDIDQGRYDRYHELEDELYQLRNTYTGRKKFGL